MKLRPPPLAARRVKISPRTHAPVNAPKRNAKGEFLSPGRRRHMLDETDAIGSRIQNP